MRWPALAAALLLVPACGGDDEPTAADLDGRWDVVLVVGAAIADPAADTSAFPGEGSDFTEPWTLDCDDDGCTLHREPAPPLGVLDDLRLEATDDDEVTVRGEATEVTPAPSVEEPSPCEGTPAETFTVTVEVTLRDHILVGSVFRIPDALVSGDCYGLDLTLGLSGSPAGSPAG